MEANTNEKLFHFIQNSPTSFHAVRTMAEALRKEGYTKLEEHTSWDLAPGGRYYVTRNCSSLIAFRIPRQIDGGFLITASHSDSPSFKIKENPELKSEGLYVRLNVEKYGGMLMAPWLDRPLSFAGRVVVEEKGQITTKLIDLDRDLLLIPNVAIHMNRDVNSGYHYDMKTDLLPLYGGPDTGGSFSRLIAGAAGVEEDAVLGHDLFLYSRTPGTVWGADSEFISCGRLDDLQCAFASLEGFLSSGKEETSSVPVHCVLDNEETGSQTKQGAASTFLKDTLRRITLCLGLSEEDYLSMLSSSFMLSADNAHAVHPNHPELSDPVNRPQMNKGVVIKFNASQRYTTDGISAALFRALCKKEKIPCQTFLNRSDMAGGSTLGNISNTQAAMNTVDIGLAQLSMHSPYETAGAQDTDYLIRACRAFFNCSIRCCRDGAYTFF